MIIRLAKQDEVLNLTRMNKYSDIQIGYNVTANISSKDQSPKLLPFEFNGDFLLLSNQLPSCYVTDKKCILNFLVKISVDFSNFEVKSSNENIIKVKYFELCKNFERHEICKEVKEFIGDSDQIKIYTIHLKPANIGNSSLFLTFNLRNKTFSQTYFLNHSILIIQPESLEDILFNYNSLILQILSSLLLGISMDVELIKKNIRLPKPYMIGLTFQFIIMPLVIFFN